MDRVDLVPRPVVDLLTVVAIAAIAISLNVAFHEGVHALACLAVGGSLKAYSALYASCDNSTVLQGKIVAGSAPTFNLIAGTLVWIFLRNSREITSETRLFLWLFMLMNWLYGAGYFILSGIVNIGDWTVVIEGWESIWLWRVVMTIAGTLLYIILVWLAFQQFGRMIGGDDYERTLRAKKICTVSYLTSFVVVLFAGCFCPYGLLSLPVTAGLTAVLGALSPLIWMMRWFKTNNVVKPAREALEIHRKWQWLGGSAIVVFTYVFILGRTLYF
jgi:hypothetical protein